MKEIIQVAFMVFAMVVIVALVVSASVINIRDYVRSKYDWADYNCDGEITITDYTLHRLEYLEEAEEIRQILYGKWGEGE